MWYFAYASNMLTQQIEERVHRGGLPWLMGTLEGYMIRFNKKSTVDHSGKANMVPVTGGKVWGVLFELSEEELQFLGRFEQGYEAHPIDVLVPGHRSQMMNAIAFFADAEAPLVAPTKEYLKRIVDGAREHGLPRDYCQHLAETPTKETRP